MATINKGILTKFYTDAEGNVISVKVNREQRSISSINYVVTLEGIPEEFNRVICVNYSINLLYSSSGIFFITSVIIPLLSNVL